MKSTTKVSSSVLAFVVFVTAIGVFAQAASSQTSVKANDKGGSVVPLDSLEGLEIQAVSENGGDLTKVKADVATYRGRRAVHVLNDDSAMTTGGPTGGETLAVVKGSYFRDGTIEVDLVGMPRQGAPPDARGFIGVAFRVQDHGARYEAFYLRFTNARSDDQVRRNRSTQYMSQPDYPWARLRKESPGFMNRMLTSNKTRGRRSKSSFRAPRRSFT